MSDQSTTKPLDEPLESRLAAFAKALVDQEAARVIVPPQQPAEGFWFGGGNMVVGADGHLYLVGRYRNHGDSRTGLGRGERGLELAIFRSDNRGATWQKVVEFTKADLNVGDREVLSIEGSALRFTESGVEVFVSTEKSGIGYPAGIEDYLKPGTGVWTIERLAAESIDTLTDAPIKTIAECRDLRFLHVKDPFLYETATGDLMLLFCTHPFCWTSSNTARMIRPNGANDFSPPIFDFFPRGFTWDVAITRGTCILDVPPIGPFADRRVSLLFYDGGECVRNLDQYASAVKRPRGYSCEELGGAAYFLDSDFDHAHRLSKYAPLFISPHGTGCSRYVDVLRTDDGFYATWQQSQRDFSQPLVMSFLPMEAAEKMLTA